MHPPESTLRSYLEQAKALTAAAPLFLASLTGCVHDAAKAASADGVSRAVQVATPSSSECINIGSKENPKCLDGDEARKFVSDLVDATKGNALSVARCFPVHWETQKLDCARVLVINTAEGPIYSVNAAFTDMNEAGKPNLQTGMDQQTIFANALNLKLGQAPDDKEKNEFLMEEVRDLKIDDPKVAEIFTLKTSGKKIVIDNGPVNATALIFSLKNANAKDLPSFFTVSGTRINRMGKSEPFTIRVVVSR